MNIYDGRIGRTSSDQSTFWLGMKCVVAPGKRREINNGNIDLFVKQTNKFTYKKEV